MEPGSQSLAGTFQIWNGLEPLSHVCVTEADPSTEAPGVTNIDVHANAARENTAVVRIMTIGTMQALRHIQPFFFTILQSSSVTPC